MTRQQHARGAARPTPVAARAKLPVWIVVALAAFFIGCEEEVDPTPEKLDGTPSHEFEQEDLDAAEQASDAAKEYCADAVSEAQRLGCESHVTEDQIP